MTQPREYDWPLRLRHRLPGGHELVLRELTPGDEAEWLQLWSDNVGGLTAAMTTDPAGPGAPSSYGQVIERLDAKARAGEHLPFVMAYDGRLVGQMQVTDVLRGGHQRGSAGYWVDQEHRGRRIAVYGLAMLIDEALGGFGLHRVEVAIRPENAASLSVAHRLGLRSEGLSRGLMYIDGGWRDHEVFAVTAEEIGEQPMIDRLG